jgi:YVTN family beta-propeller protein
VNFSSNTVSVIDTSTTPPSVTATVTVGTSPQGVAVTPDGTRVYVTNQADNTVSVIDTTTTPPHIKSTIAVGTSPTWLGESSGLECDRLGDGIDGGRGAAQGKARLEGKGIRVAKHDRKLWAEGEEGHASKVRRWRRNDAHASGEISDCDCSDRNVSTTRL